MKINHNTAEFIGRPVFEKVVQSFVDSDRQALIDHFPDLRQWMTPEFFDEAVIVLNRLGECESVKYSFYATKADYNSLAWDLVYSLEEEPVRWYLYLADDQDEIMVRGFSFDR